MTRRGGGRGGRRGTYTSWVGNPDGRRPLGRSRHRWKDNISGSLKSRLGRHELDGSGSGYGQVVGACECGNVSLGSVKCREFLD